MRHRVRRSPDLTEPLEKPAAKPKRVDYRSERLALQGARARCEHRGNKDFADYGARGIRVATQWRGRYGFDEFIAHIGPKPTPRHTLDRIDNERGYEPGNVRWASWIEQANNRRSSRLIAWRGETLTAANWARRLGVRRQDVSNRMNRGWPLELVLNPSPTLSEQLLVVADFIGSTIDPSAPSDWKLRLVQACLIAAEQLSDT